MAPVPPGWPPREVITMRHRILIVGLAAILFIGVGAVFGLHQGESPNANTAQASSSLTPGQAPADQLAGSIARAQEHLRTVPGDYAAWAELGSAYIERARVTADPTYYPKAEGALRRSLNLRPSGNSAALVGLGALGNPPAATEAIQHMLDLRPGLAAYARASYDLEQQGRLGDAAALMRRALGDAVDPADIAFCRYQLGELAWRSGRLDDAGTEYAAGQAADPGYLPLLASQARVAAAHEHTIAALTDYAKLTTRYPSPGYLMDYATLLRATGQPAHTGQQLALAAAALRLFRANGGTDDLGVAQLALARGQSRQAILAAKREWSRRHFADVADVLGWALHRSGTNAEAIFYARKADALGADNSGYLFHLGMIELSLGRNGDARRDLSAALALNPHFSPLDAPIATAALHRLGPR